MLGAKSSWVWSNRLIMKYGFVVAVLGLIVVREFGAESQQLGCFNGILQRGSVEEARELERQRVKDRSHRQMLFSLYPVAWERIEGDFRTRLICEQILLSPLSNTMISRSK